MAIGVYPLGAENGRKRDGSSNLVQKRLTLSNQGGNQLLLDYGISAMREGSVSRAITKVKLHA